MMIFVLFIDQRWRWSGKEIPSFVITLPGKDHRLTKIQQLFREYAQLELIPFYGFDGNEYFRKNPREKRFGLTKGQRGLRETMKMFFNFTLMKNYDEVLVFQDDAIPHRNFSSLFVHLHRRCVEADILLLGASMWHGNKDRWPNETCFDADRMTFGAYALQVKRKAFQPILIWLNQVQHITFDHIYPSLQKNGLIVRVAHPPFLVIMDVSHPSSINRHRVSFQYNLAIRAKLHRWNLKEYPLHTFDERQSENVRRKVKGQ